MKKVLTVILLLLSIVSTAQDSIISKSDLNSVAKVFDLTFSQKEIDTSSPLNGGLQLQLLFLQIKMISHFIR